MANLSYSVYPDAIDGYATMPLRRDGVHEIVAADHNRLRDAIIKIEQELGVQPSGTFATVAARLNYIGDAKALILAHIADTEDAHDASAISIEDAADHYFEEDVEGALEELSTLLPPEPDNIGEDNSKVPNDGIPNFYDGYGTKFVFNTSSGDSIHKSTQPSAVSGIRGIHIVEIGMGNDDGYAQMRMTGGVGAEQLEWMAPGDSAYGSPVSVASLSAGDTVILSSSDATKRIKVARNSQPLAIVSGEIVEGFEIYDADFVTGYYSLPSEGFRQSQYITRTAANRTGVSRMQCMISGMVFPADRGTLVLQRKTRGVDGAIDGSTGFWPIATLGLGSIFDDTKRSDGQPVYTPSMDLFDTITLYDRYPIMNDYTLVDENADGNPPYNNFENTFTRMQVAKYLIPISNSDVVGATLDSPDDITEGEANDTISGYRIFHYKEGITDFNGDPTADELYSISDVTHPSDQQNANYVVRYSNFYVDTSVTRPGVELVNLRPTEDLPSIDGTTMRSGVKYYNAESSVDKDLFDFELRSDNNVFNKTYLTSNILTFETDVFDFPHGTDDGQYGAQVDITELTDDGYYKFSTSNLPAHEDQAFYIVDSTTLINGATTNDDRRIYPAPNRFSNHSFIRATMHDPFGTGDGYDAYGAESIHRILVNSYSPTRATDTIEYFTDESHRIDDSEEFYNPGVDGYSFPAFDKQSVLESHSLQVGGRFTSDEFNIAGLIYPQTDYYNVRFRIRPLQVNDADMDYSQCTGHRWYQRLFGFGYPINSGRLRIVSDGNSPISFWDIQYTNPNRFGKVEIKIPGTGTNSTEWMDISRLYSTGDYEDGYGSLSGEVIGSSGNFIVPFTFGYRNTADSDGYFALRVTYFGDPAISGQLERSKRKIMTMIQLLT